MSERTIEITINEDGSIEIEANGFKGKGCQKAIDDLTRSLGTVKKRKSKPELFVKDRDTRKT